jgi:hypothetical protein
MQIIICMAIIIVTLLPGLEAGRENCTPVGIVQLFYGSYTRSHRHLFVIFINFSLFFFVNWLLWNCVSCTLVLIFYTATEIILELCRIHKTRG